MITIRKQSSAKVVIRVSLSALIACGGVSVSAVAAQDVAQTPQATGNSFVETFNSLSIRRWYTSHGWTNGPHQGCTWSKQNIRLGKNNLELILNDRAFKERKHSCAEIQTRERFGHGTYEVRMRAAPVSGVVSAFFTYIGPFPGEETQTHHEIDFEFLGKNTAEVQLNFFGEGKGGNERWVKLDFDASKTSAEYAFEWLPDRIRWFVNGRMVHEVMKTDDKPFPTLPQKIMLSIWNAEGLEEWTGPFTFPGKPVSAVFERVAFTKAGDPCQFKESVVCLQQRSADAEIPKPVADQR